MAPIEISMRRTRWALRLLFFMSGLGLASWAPIVPFVKTQLNLDEADLGLVLLAFGVGALFSMPITGWLVHKFGSRQISTLAGFLFVIVLPLLVLAPTAIILSLCLFLFGAILGALNISVNAQAVFVERKSATPLMAGFHCLFSLGCFAGTLLVSAFLELGSSLLISACAISLVIFFIIGSQYRFLLPFSEDSNGVKSSKSFSWPSGIVFLLGALCFICFMAEGAMLDWSAVFLRYSRGYDTSIAGIGYAFFAVAMTLGRFLGDRLIQRFGPLFMLQIESLIAAIGFLIAVNGTWGYIELLGFFMIGFGASTIVPILFSATGRLTETSSNLALTVVITFGYTGLLIGPAIIGFVAEVTSLSFALTGIAGLLILVAFGGRLIQPSLAPQKLG